MIKVNFSDIYCEEAKNSVGLYDNEAIGVPVGVFYTVKDERGFTKTHTQSFTREEARTIYDILEKVHDRARKCFYDVSDT